MSLLDETAEALRFFSRLPIPGGTADFPSALRRAPLAGALLGLLGGAALALALRLGAPPNVAAWLTLGFSALITGAMHEDGLADVTDGLGGFTREKRLEIMRDSRIGAFGVAALIVSFGVRASALAALGVAPMRAVAVLVAVGAISRAAALAPLVYAPPARENGAGRAAMLTAQDARPAFVLAAAFMVLPWLAGFSLAACLLALALAAAFSRGLTAFAVEKFGGQTGDVAGATQQAAEIALLCVFAGGIA